MLSILQYCVFLLMTIHQTTIIRQCRRTADQCRRFIIPGPIQAVDSRNPQQARIPLLSQFSFSIQCVRYLGSTHKLTHPHYRANNDHVYGCNCSSIQSHWTFNSATGTCFPQNRSRSSVDGIHTVVVISNIQDLAAVQCRAWLNLLAQMDRKQFDLQ